MAGDFAWKSGRTRAVLVVGVLVFSSFAALSSARIVSTPGLGTSHFGPDSTTLDSKSPRTPSVHPSPTGEGSVISTINLVTNQSTPGSTEPPTEDTPIMAVYDAVNGDVYLRTAYGDYLLVIDTATNRVIADVPIPYEQISYDTLVPTFAVDPHNGTIYASNSQDSGLTIINGTSNEVTGSVSLGGTPAALVYDPANETFFVSNWGTDQVDVVNASTDVVGPRIWVGEHPYAILYDPVSHSVFVANYFSGNVSIINAWTDQVTATVSGGSTSAYPAALALDTDNDSIDVANSHDGNLGTVTVIPATHPGGSYAIYVGLDPEAMAYVPKQNEMFVTDDSSAVGNLSIINQTIGTVVASPISGDAPAAAVYDPVGNAVYVLNSESPFNVTIFSPSTNRAIGNVSIGNWDLYAVAVDPGDGEVFAASEGSYGESGAVVDTQANATVISGTTHHGIDSIPLGAYPMGLTYDSINDQVIAADPGGNDTFNLDPSTGAIDGTSPVGALPEQSAVDSYNGETYVLDATNETPRTGAVTVLDSEMQPVTTIVVSSDPSAIAYDAADGDFYITDEYWGNITVLNGTHNAYVATISVKEYNELYAILYDPHNRDLYVSNGDTNDNITVLNGSEDPALLTSGSLFLGNVTVGSEPDSLAFDSQNDTVFTANWGSDNTSVISDSKNQVVETIPNTVLPNPGFFAYDGATNTLYSAWTSTGTVEPINASTYQTEGSAISLDSETSTGGILYDLVDQRVYVSNTYEGTISVIGAPPPGAYPVNFTESGLPAGTSWSITLGGTPQSSTTNTISFTDPNDTYSYTVGSVTGYTPNVTSASLTVAGAPVNVFIGFTANTYPLTFTETGLPSGTSWSITVNGLLNSSTGSAIVFKVTNGLYNWVVGTVSHYVPNATSGNTEVNSGPATVPITFTYSATHVAYAVTFNETGLPAGTSWSVVFNGSQNFSTGTQVTFEATNGTYSYSVGPAAEYTPNVVGGVVTVEGLPVGVDIHFSAGVPVTFTETGLPAGTSWSVTVGTTEKSGTGSSLDFTETNGSYNFTVGAVAGYRASPASGSFPVSGLQVTVSIGFSSTSSSQATSSLPSPLEAEIVGGAALAVIVALLVFLFVVARRRRKKKEDEEDGATDSQSFSGREPPSE